MDQREIPLRARVLTEALPYIKLLRGKTVVIKFGGTTMERVEIQERFASDVVLMRYVGINPVVVHGGGPQITEYMESMSKEVRFVEGHRVTDAETMDVANMVLGGKINKSIVSMINRHGTLSMGLSGVDGNLIIAEKKESESGEDLGWVGEVRSVNAGLIRELLRQEMVPVIASTATDTEGNSYNINADTVVGEIAIALRADKIIYLTNVKGVLAKDGGLISVLDVNGCLEMLARGEISAGMIPKVESCVKALNAGVNRTHIIDGTTDHALLLEVFTDDGVGTMIVKETQGSEGGGTDG